MQLRGELRVGLEIGIGNKVKLHLHNLPRVTRDSDCELSTKQDLLANFEEEKQLELDMCQRTLACVPCMHMYVCMYNRLPYTMYVPIRILQFTGQLRLLQAHPSLK
jgi:hypothetical protein